MIIVKKSGTDIPYQTFPESKQLILKWMIFRHIPQILPHIPMQQQIYIVHWSIIDQPIQFAGFVHIPGDLAFDSDTVNRDYATIGIFDLDTGGVDIELTRDNLIHVVLPKTKIIRTLLLLR